MLPGARRSDDQMSVCGQLIGAGEVLAHEEIPSDGTLHVVCDDVLCFIDVVAAKGSFVATQHILVVWGVRGFWKHQLHGHVTVAGIDQHAIGLGFIRTGRFDPDQMPCTNQGIVPKELNQAGPEFRRESLQLQASSTESFS